MKKYNFLLFAIVFLVTACQEDFIDKQSLIDITEDNFYQTEDDAIAAVNAAYAALQFEMTPAGHFRWFWGDVMSDDSEKGGSGDNDVNILLRLETFQGPTNSDLLESEWAADYEGIYRANIVLEKIPAIDMNEDLKAEILGEAKFIRAWFFYNLVTMFGDVPLVDRVLLPSEYTMGSSPASDIWALIEQDLTEAAPVLPLRSDLLNAELGRITRGAANALLAKAYLYQQKFAEAAPVLEEVISSNQYQLVADYNSIFTPGGQNNSESIFEIQYMNASGGNWGRNNANEGTFTPVFTRARGQFEGYGFNLPTQDFVDEFFKEGFEDPRLSATVFRVGDSMGDRGAFTIEATGGLPHLYYSKKYFTNKSETAPFGDPNPNGGTNDRVIRFADVLLMHAEASYHTGKEDAAKESLNKVRARARAGNPNVLPDVNATGNALLEAIYHERRVELGMEGHRFFDLVRTGRGTEELGPLGYQEGVHNLFPIPESQIQASNGSITQNPGY